MVKTMLNTGMRLGEAVFLEWQDIDFNVGQIKIRNKPKIGFHPKNKKERNIPIPDDLINELRSKKKKRGFVFSTQNGGPRKNNLRRELAKTGVKAGIEKRVYPHILRHTYGSHLAMAGVDLPSIAVKYHAFIELSHAVGFPPVVDSVRPRLYIRFQHIFPSVMGTIIERADEIIVIIGKFHKHRKYLSQVHHALDLPGALPGSLEGWQQHRGQYADYGNNHQKFDEGETLFLLFTFHGVTPIQSLHSVDKYYLSGPDFIVHV